MALRQSRYEIRAGRARPHRGAGGNARFPGLHAKTRRVAIAGMETSGLVVGPGYTPGSNPAGAIARAKPGEYTVTLSATSETGEERQTTMNVVVEAQVAVPSNSTRPPVVLLNGWLTGFTNSCPIATISATFGNLAQYLVSDGVPVVYLFDNCVVDPGNTIEALGADLGAFLNTIKYDSGAQVPQIDLVAHSMGGLIARAYLAGIQPNQTFLPPAPTLVRKLVLIATPNFGSFVAGNYVYSIAAGSQSAELVPGSAFLWNLATWNQRGDDLRGVNAIAVVGNAGSYVPSLSSSYVLQ
jgi:pimeloyl-ACP methyl ester carboxylesterase